MQYCKTQPSYDARLQTATISNNDLTIFTPQKRVPGCLVHVSFALYRRGRGRACRKMQRKRLRRKSSLLPALRGASRERYEGQRRQTSITTHIQLQGRTRASIQPAKWRLRFSVCTLKLPCGKVQSPESILSLSLSLSLWLWSWNTEKTIHEPTDATYLGRKVCNKK